MSEKRSRGRRRRERGMEGETGQRYRKRIEGGMGGVERREG